MILNQKRLFIYLKIIIKLSIFSIVLKDNRFVVGSSSNIIIYNNKTFKPDLIIKEHDSSINSLRQLSSGILASCSDDKTIKLFQINNNSYLVKQTLNEHESGICGIIEINNNRLVSCSKDNSILFYLKNDNKYEKEYKFQTEGECWNIIQTKDNEICFSDYKNGTHSICFYNLEERKIINKINNINVSEVNCFNIIANDLLLINGIYNLYIININNKSLARVIKVPDSGYIIGFCPLNKNYFLTGDSKRKIKQWKIEGDNLKLISTKENAHDTTIWTLLKLGDGHILSGAFFSCIKIW